MNDTICYLLSHGCVLQFCISIGSPSHLFPPFLSGVTIVRVLPCIPPPQVRVHKSHLVQSLHSQSTTFQDTKMYCYVKFGPKYKDIFNWIFSNYNAASFQRIPGHPCILQSLNSVDCPIQSIPPFNADCCSTRVLFWEPPSHGLLHSLQAVKGPHLQFPKIYFYAQYFWGIVLRKNIRSYEEIYNSSLSYLDRDGYYKLWFRQHIHCILFLHILPFA